MFYMLRSFASAGAASTHLDPSIEKYRDTLISQPLDKTLRSLVTHPLLKRYVYSGQIILNSFDIHSRPVANNMLNRSREFRRRVVDVFTRATPAIPDDYEAVDSVPSQQRPNAARPPTFS
jgi:hypothetical protein